MSSWLPLSYKRNAIKKKEIPIEFPLTLTYIYAKMSGLTESEKERIGNRDLRDLAKVRNYEDTEYIHFFDKSEIYYDNTTRMFNAGLIVDSNGTYDYHICSDDDSIYMLYRECPFTYDKNAAILCNIDINTLVTSDFKDICEYTDIGNYEDIRFLIFKGELYISYTHHMNMKISKFSIETGDITDVDISFDEFPKEKNWTFFENNGVLYGIRYYSPLQIYIIDLEQNSIRLYSTYEWKFNHPCSLIQLRGGAPPILLNGKYYVFLHSSVTYYIYAMTFDAVTFQPLSYTPEPLFNEIESYVKFTCGALFDERNQEWNVCFGVDDLECAIGKISLEELEGRMVPISHA
jgi:hypothetical protein